MLEVVRRSTSYCPRCGKKVLYFATNSQLLMPDESGKHATQILDELESIEAVCPCCMVKYHMVRTVYGIMPEQMAREKYLGFKDPKYSETNPIGFTTKEVESVECDKERYIS